LWLLSECNRSSTQGSIGMPRRVLALHPEHPLLGTDRVPERGLFDDRA
jgi:hypothetical protein